MLVHVGVTLVPGVVGVPHGHLGGGGEGHHGRLDVGLHVGGQGVGAGPLGGDRGGVGRPGHVGVRGHLPRPPSWRGRGVMTGAPRGQIVVTRAWRGRGAGLLPHWRTVLASGRGRGLVSSHSYW